MSDKKLVASVLKYCKSEYSYALDNFIDDRYVIFNDLDQCTHLDLKSEGLNYIPNELLELKHLGSLDLRFNSIKEIPKPLVDSID